MKVIAIANPAGGTGKTTLSHALAVAFAEFGKKTLLIDLDPSGSLTFRLGLENPRITITEFISGVKATEENLSSTAERFDFIASDSRLAANLDDYAISAVLGSLPKEYDLVILDNPPTLTSALGASLKVADHVFAPVTQSLHSLRGLIQLRKITETTVTAIPVGDVNYEELAPVLDVAILRSSDVEIAATSKVSVLSTDKSSDVAENYRSAAYSILEILGLE
jgi:MinD-like ATPase involved in chromosome partitioning or flagellar assembly